MMFGVIRGSANRPNIRDRLHENTSRRSPKVAEARPENVLPAGTHNEITVRTRLKETYVGSEYLVGLFVEPLRDSNAKDRDGFPINIEIRMKIRVV